MQRSQCRLLCHGENPPTRWYKISLTPLFLAESEEGEDGNEGEEEEGEGIEEERYEFTEEDIIIEEAPPEVKVKFRNIFLSQ